MYAQNAISTNEFLGHSWSKVRILLLENKTKMIKLHRNSSLCVFHVLLQKLPGQNVSLGVEVLTSRGVFPEAKWYWIGFGALIGYLFLFNILFTLAITYLNREYTSTINCPLKVKNLVWISYVEYDVFIFAAFGKGQQVISEETLNEKHANLTGEVLEGSSRGRISANTSASQSMSVLSLFFFLSSFIFKGSKYILLLRTFKLVFF